MQQDIELAICQLRLEFGARAAPALFVEYQKFDAFYVFEQTMLSAPDNPGDRRIGAFTVQRSDNGQQIACVPDGGQAQNTN